MTSLEIIKEKLSRLKALDLDFLIFGADSHTYNFNPTLSENEVSVFEQEHNIRLPEEYRLFITQIGNGGAGPFYGLYTLKDNEGDGSEEDIKFPFPFSAANPFNLRDLLLNLDILYYDANTSQNENTAWEELNKKIVSESYSRTNRGTIYLCTEGCGMYSVLVVNGAEYGNVWFVDLTNGLGVFPIIDPATGKPVGFFRWYELWLDSAIAEERSEDENDRWSGEGMLSYTDYVTQLQYMMNNE